MCVGLPRGGMGIGQMWNKNGREILFLHFLFLKYVHVLHILKS